jgi:lipopolysaccharide export system protein LptC
VSTVVEMDYSTTWREPAAFPIRFSDPHERLSAFRAARRHSRLVRRLRIALPAAGALALAALTIAAHLSLPANLDLSVAGLSVTRNSIIMDNPHLTGFDADKREYSVSADRAIQALANPDAVRLEDITATVKVEGQGTATITAESGDYDNGKSTLQLYGGIAVDSSEGYALRMSDAQIDLRGGTMTSPNPVTVSYQDSRTSGRSISVTGGGKSIVLQGDVRTTLMPPKRGRAPQPGAPAGE